MGTQARELEADAGERPRQLSSSLCLSTLHRCLSASSFSYPQRGEALAEDFTPGRRQSQGPNLPVSISKGSVLGHMCFSFRECVTSAGAPTPHWECLTKWGERSPLGMYHGVKGQSEEVCHAGWDSREIKGLKRSFRNKTGMIISTQA